MASFSEQERAFFTAPNIVHLATVGADGGPNVSAVWADLDGEPRGVPRRTTSSATRRSRSPW